MNRETKSGFKRSQLAKVNTQEGRVREAGRTSNVEIRKDRGVTQAGRRCVHAGGETRCLFSDRKGAKKKLGGYQGGRRAKRVWGLATHWCEGNRHFRKWNSEKKLQSPGK